MSLVREVLPTLNNGQFLELLPLFSDKEKRLFFYMTTEQAISYHEAILNENGSLLMRIFLGELAVIQNGLSAPEASLKHRKTGDASESGLRRHVEWEKEDGQEDMTASPSSNQLVPALVFHQDDAFENDGGKNYRLMLDNASRVLSEQLSGYMQHMTVAINVNRKGPKVSSATIEERQRTLLAYLGYLCNIRGADGRKVTMEHVLCKEHVLAFDEWTDSNRRTKASTRRKRMAHLVIFADYVFILFPALADEYSDVPGVYRRLVSQLDYESKLQERTEPELIRDGSFLPYAVMLELLPCVERGFHNSLTEGREKVECARLMHDVVLLHILVLYGWRNTEVTSLELVDEKNVAGMAQRAGYSSAASFLARTQRNLVVRSAHGGYVVHTTSYKTVAKGKRISDTLIPEVGHLLDQYLDGGHRKLLLGKTGDRHLFFGENGSTITAASGYLPSLFEKLTGVRLLCNLRRRAMTSYCLAKGIDCESLAKLQRHTVRTQKVSYDMRSNDTQTQAAINSITSDFKKRCRRDSEEDAPVMHVGDVVCWDRRRMSVGNYSLVYGKVVDVHAREQVLVIPLVSSQFKDGAEMQMRLPFGNSNFLAEYGAFQLISVSAIEKVDAVEEEGGVFSFRPQKKPGK